MCKKIRKGIRKYFVRIWDSDPTNALVMDLFIAFLTLLVVTVILIATIITTPSDEQNYYNLIISSYVPTFFTLCMGTVLQAQVYAVQHSRTKCMPSLIMIVLTFLYLFQYAFLIDGNTLISVLIELPLSALLYYLCHASFKHVVSNDETSVGSISA